MESYFIRLLFVPAAAMYYLFARSLISSPYRKMRKKAQRKNQAIGSGQKESILRRFIGWLWFSGLNAKKNAVLLLNKIASSGLMILMLCHVLLGWIPSAIPFLLYAETAGYAALIPFMCGALAAHYRKKYGTALFLYRKSENHGVDSSLFFPILALFPAAMALALWLI